MNRQTKYRLIRALEAIESACNKLHAIEETLDAEDREAWNEEAKAHLAAGFESLAKDGLTVGGFLNPVPDDWDLRYL